MELRDIGTSTTARYNYARRLIGRLEQFGDLMLTVRCDTRDRSPISVGKILRTLVPRECVCHVDGLESVNEEKSGKSLVGLLRGVI